MTNKRTFLVSAIGIAEHERSVLDNIFRLSQYRSRTYALSAPTSKHMKDILIVDPEGENAMADWRLFRDRFPATPTVLVTMDAASPAQPYCTRRPFVATRVLGVLDQVAIKEFSYAPEIVIGANEEDRSSNAVVDRVVSNNSGARVAPSRYMALVVDDSQAVRKQIELQLRLLNVSADYAESGEQAMGLLENKSYDVIFLDVVMPGLDGYQVCKLVKKDKFKRGTPVVMLTGKSSPFDRIRGTFAGCDTYLTKPVEHDAFRKIVEKYLH